MNILIRDVPESLVARLDAEATASGQSRQEFMIKLLEKHFGEPSAILGYIPLARRGDISKDEPCPECGSPLAKPFLWFASDSTFGIVCDICATSE